jgi:hypothetical protein
VNHSVETHRLITAWPYVRLEVIEHRRDPQATASLGLVTGHAPAVTGARRETGAAGMNPALGFRATTPVPGCILRQP